jgi:bifunctional NMN adenylyltransferase/nudix hydrolase
MKYQYDIILFIGRFQPFHIGHQQVIEHALQLANHVIVAVGSSNRSRSVKNPFTFDERKQMIMDCIWEKDRITVLPLRDQMYSDADWITSVNALVYGTISDKALKSSKIAIIGHNKDSSSYYLRLFPQWTLINRPMSTVINATDVRELIFGNKSPRFLTGVLPESSFLAVDQLSKLPVMQDLKDEYQFLIKYRQLWSGTPYPVVFQTVDAIIVHSSHVLLIKRGRSPGKGLTALIGGFLDPGERLDDCVLREVAEETNIGVTKNELRHSLVSTKVFDHPSRSERGRTITHAYLFHLPPGPLPFVEGGDDAAHAEWVPLGSWKEEDFFEDHYHILTHMLRML